MSTLAVTTLLIGFLIVGGIVGWIAHGDYPADPCATVQNVTVRPTGLNWKMRNLHYDLQPGTHYSLPSAQREALVLDCELRKEVR